MAKLEPSDADIETSMANLLAAARGETTKPVDEAWRSEVKSMINNVGWSARSLQLQHLFREFVVDVATATNFRTVVDGLFVAYCKSFIPALEENKAAPPNANGAQSEFLFCLIRDICWRVPIVMQALPAVVLQNQPILKRPPAEHSAYCTSVLHLSAVARVVRRQLVSTVVSHLLGLDVRLPRELVLSGVKQQTRLPKETNELINKLDQCMDAVFEFVEKLPELSLAINSNDDPINLICEFFVDALSAFDAVVFRSKGASHINFILFYACARYPQLSARLLHHLWARIEAEDRAVESRRSALFYFASFVARAKFINADQLRTSVEHLAKFAHFMRSNIVPPSDDQNNNNSNDSGNNNGSGSIIGLFDAAVEALIYVVSFHHNTLCSGALGFRFVRSLKLGELINCPSDPLSRCRKSVVDIFYQVADRYQLSLYDRSSRTSFRTESMCSIASTPGDVDLSENPMLLAAAAVESAMLTGYFPFDPYALPHSSQKLKPFYAEFDISELIASSDESDGMESDVSEDTDIDDDEMKFEEEMM